MVAILVYVFSFFFFLLHFFLSFVCVYFLFVRSLEHLDSLPSHLIHHSSYLSSYYGVCHYELNHYSKAADYFQHQLNIAPYNFMNFEYYSTALWHLRKEMELSYLTQHCMNMDKSAPQTWMAAGNLFSSRREREVALKFFKRVR